MRSALCGVAMLALVTCGRASWAQGDAASERHRRELVEQAAAASRAGDHPGAIDLMTRAGALRMTPALRMVMAQEQQLAGRAPDAFDSATRCLAELGSSAEAEGRAQVASECQSLVNALRPRVGRLRLITPTPAPPGFHVALGGRELGAPSSPLLVTVAPGPATITAGASDGTRFEATVSVPAGGEQTVAIALSRGPAATPAATPAPTADEAPGEVTQVAAGDGNVCVRQTGGRVRCWGSSVGGASGFVPIAGLDRASSVSLRSRHACAVVTGGRVRCWGDLPLRPWGQDTPESERVPREVAGLTGVVSVAAGYQHTCAVLEGGGVRCWGANGAGQLGDGTTEAREVPVEVAGLGPAAEVVAANGITCARLRDGTVACWGANADGQAGADAGDHATRPTPIVGLSGVVQLALGDDYACAARDDGSAWCWGSRASGRFGSAEAGVARRPVAVPGLSGVAELAAGSRHVCARLRSRAVVCWGDNEQGALGARRVAQPFRPHRVAALRPSLALSASAWMSCALQVDGAVRCWGRVPSSRLGEVRDAPTPTAMPLDAQSAP